MAVHDKRTFTGGNGEAIADEGGGLCWGNGRRGTAWQFDAVIARWRSKMLPIGQDFQKRGGENLQTLWKGGKVADAGKSLQSCLCWREVTKKTKVEYQDQEKSARKRERGPKKGGANTQVSFQPNKTAREETRFCLAQGTKRGPGRNLMERSGGLHQTRDIERL